QMPIGASAAAVISKTARAAWLSSGFAFSAPAGSECPTSSAPARSRPTKVTRADLPRSRTGGSVCSAKCLGGVAGGGGRMGDGGGKPMEKERAGTGGGGGGRPEKTGRRVGGETKIIIPGAWFIRPPPRLNPPPPSPLCREAPPCSVSGAPPQPPAD